MRRTDLARHSMKSKAARTSQIVFGERQHLLRVLDSLERSLLSRARMDQERRILERLIHQRTEELNTINVQWDEKVSAVLNADARPEMLEDLHKRSPKEDYYLLRLISEHPSASPKTLRLLARHPYAAIRENIARHPNADAPTLTRLSQDKTQPLWYLVAFNPSTPPDLRKKLQDRMHKMGEAAPSQ
jgi:hypothetical protein